MSNFDYNKLYTTYKEGGFIRKNSLRRQSISSYFLMLMLLIMIVLIGIQYMLFQSSNRMYMNELEASASSNLYYLKQSLDQTIESLRMEAENIFKQEDVGWLLTPESTSKTSVYYSHISEIQDLMMQILRANPLLASGRLFVVKQNMSIYTSVRGNALSNAPQRKVEYYTSEEMSDYLANVSSNKASLMVMDGKFCLPVLCWSRFTTEGSTPFVMEFIFSDDSLSNTLSAYAAYNEQKAYMLDHRSGLLLSSENLSDSFSLPLLERQETDELWQFSIELEEKPYIAAVRYYGDMDISFVQLIPENRMRSFWYFSIMYFGLFLAICLISFLWYVHQVRQLIQQPVHEMLVAFGKLGHGDMEVNLPPQRAREFQQLAVHFNRMKTQLNDLIQKNYEQVIRLQRSEYKQLQSQINPHFLYNSLFLVRHLIEEDEKTAALEYLSHLSEFYRYITRNGQDEIPFLEEVQHASHYMFVQLQRFDFFLHCRFAPVPQEIEALPVPRLILQPILENAIVHCPPSAEHPLTITVDYRRDGDMWIITIQNDGRLAQETLDNLQEQLAIRNEQVRETTGLVNICRRLRFFSNGQGDLRVSRGNTGGLKVEILLPTAHNKKESGSGACTES